MGMPILIAAVATLSVLLAIFGISALVRSLSDQGRRRSRARAKAMARELEADIPVDALRSRSLSKVGWLDQMLSRLSFAARLEQTVAQANSRISVGMWVVAMVVSGVFGAWLGTWMFSSMLPGLAMALPGGWVPYFLLRRQRARRMDKFQRQLPDAMDLIARSLKAGHTFTGGLRMVADEFDDPIGTEFGQALDEINFGMDPDRALANLVERVECEDLKFFVVSVNIQRETGGNLAEIVESIASLVRDRFKLFGKVRVLSAEGRLSAMILLGLPFVIALAIQFLNPDYLRVLYENSIGRMVLGMAGLSMLSGALVIRKMVNIKV